MKIALNWLKEYVDIRTSPEELAERLTMTGFEVESIEYLGKKYDKFVVGEVLEVLKHPNADKLSICKVHNGKEVLQIVCGASNVAQGQKVVVGLAGAVIPRNQHDPNGKPFTLTHIKIRNVESSGMICSSFELDLGDDKDGIMVLDRKARRGISLAQYVGLDDIVFEIGVTPNRPDVMSHFGIAREVSALLDKKLRLPKLALQGNKTDNAKFLSVEIRNKKHCPRYSARVIRNVKVEPSPRWLQLKLESVGIRPVNNIVDITNYVLMEYGQPLHAFDYDKIHGKKIIVRDAVQGETIVTLDHKARKLNVGTLLICDSQKPIAIAGIMGARDSEISAQTTSVVIESAYFHPQSIRRSSKFYVLSTDASQRFERGADPNSVLWALDRATSLIQQITRAEVPRKAIDVYSQKINPKRIYLETKKTNEVLGITINKQTISTYLAKINIKRVSSDTDGAYYSAPTYRPDLLSEIDLIEEVARLYGYNNIQVTKQSLIKFTDVPPVRNIDEDVRQWLTCNGYSEIVSNSMQEKEIAAFAGIGVVEIINPVSKEMSALRTTLVSSMLQIIRHNIFYGEKNLRLFEIGKVYSQATSLHRDINLESILEEKCLIMAITGTAEPTSWSTKPRSVDFFDLKGNIRALLAKISLDKIQFIPYSNSDPLTEEGMHIEINGTRVGKFGLIHKKLLTMFDIEQNVYMAEVTLEHVVGKRQRPPRYQELPKFPGVDRDIAFTVDASVPIEALESAILQSGSLLLKTITLFDIYTGDQVESGKKSCAFSLRFLSEEKTLTLAEIDQAMAKIIAHLSSTFNILLRQ